MLINSITSILASATTFYLAALSKLAKSETYGLSACNVSWNTIFNLRAMINILNNSYANKLLGPTIPPQLSAADYECLLGDIQEIIANGL